MFRIQQHLKSSLSPQLCSLNLYQHKWFQTVVAHDFDCSLRKEKHLRLLPYSVIVQLFRLWVFCKTISIKNRIFLYGKSFLPLYLDIALGLLLGHRFLYLSLGSDTRPCILDAYKINSIRGPLWRTRLSLQTFMQLCKHRYLQLFPNILFYVNSAHDHFFEPSKTYSADVHGYPCIPLDKNLYPEHSLRFIYEKYLNLGKLRILYIPSGDYKGTPLILEALSKASLIHGPLIEIIAPTNKYTNSEILHIMRTCHIVIDESNTDSLATATICEAVYCGCYIVTCGKFIDYNLLSKSPSLFVSEPLFLFDAINSCIRHVISETNPHRHFELLSATQNSYRDSLRNFDVFVSDWINGKINPPNTLQSHINRESLSEPYGYIYPKRLTRIDKVFSSILLSLCSIT